MSLEATDDNPLLRRTILFSGRVQGVGFRFTVCETARRFRVVGYVRNLDDGRVELVAEGERSELDRFQEAVRKAMRNNITQALANDTPATGEFTTFGVSD